MRKCVIFDLDGTLTRSEEGIWNCVRYAAEKLGFPVPDAATLRKFIGPPLGWSFIHGHERGNGEQGGVHLSRAL